MIRINKYLNGRKTIKPQGRHILTLSIKKVTTQNPSSLKINKPIVPEAEYVNPVNRTYYGASPKTKEILISRTINRDIRERERQNIIRPKINEYKYTAYNVINKNPITVRKNGDLGNALGLTYSDHSFNNIRRYIGVTPIYPIEIDEVALPKSNIYFDNTEAHEFRHAIDNATKLLPSQQRLLERAYDNNFLNLPFYHENMSKERVTTNRDARDELLGTKKMSLEEQDKRIDNASDDEIFGSIKYSNAYGRKYYEWLRQNRKLTPLKARLFREAMKHVGYNTPTQTSDFNPIYNVDIT